MSPQNADAEVITSAALNKSDRLLTHGARGGFDNTIT